MPKAIGIIPARYQSKRFPGKPLALLGGVPMVVRVLQTARNSRLLFDAYVATDDQRIASVVKEHGGKVVMTSGNHASGSDRVAEAASKLPACELVINIQGDEAFISADIIDRVVTALDEPGVSMSTACAPIVNEADADDPNVIKVVLDKDSHALYFSRSRIPYDRTGKPGSAGLYRHIGIYGFKADFLIKYASKDRTPLEISEGLEQLRALENGYSIKTIVVDGEFPGIDTREDLFKAQELLGKRER